MREKIHPYFAGLQRWIARQSDYTLSSLAEDAGLDKSTLLHAVRKGTAPSQTTIDKIRSIIELNFDQVVAMNGIAPPPTPTSAILARRARLGFESDAAPWVPKPDDEAADLVRDMAKTLGAGVAGRDIWRVHSRVMILDGFAAGDFMLVDQHAEPKAGDAVIAQVYDWDSGTATTVLRRFDPPVLTAASTNPSEWKPLSIESVKIMGVVTASWRMA